MNATDPQTPSTAWPNKLNKALMAVGIIALGLFIADRAFDTFRTGDSVPAQAQVTEQNGAPESLGVATLPLAEKVDTDASATAAVSTDSVASVEPVDEAVAQAEVPLELETLFGSKVVFVSASEPAYLVTADEQRFDVGSVVDDETTLAGLTAQQIVFEQSGDLIVISLPEPSVQ